MAVGAAQRVEQIQDNALGEILHGTDRRVGLTQILFSKIPKGDRLLAIGNFYKKVEPASRWRLGSFFDHDGELMERRFDLEMSCVLAVGREFVGEANAPSAS